MGEQPIFTCKAHVFHIDPGTKRSWIPASSVAVPVSFFYDSSRGLYRIISVEGTKAVINSTVTPNMSFTKTSQKFGQWSDVRANTVYGLGFPSEAELNKFIEQFGQVKEATKSKGGSQSQQTNGSSGQGQQGGGSMSNIPPPSMDAGGSFIGRSSGGMEDMNSNESNVNNSITMTGSLIKCSSGNHGRSQSLSAVASPAPVIEQSPKHTTESGLKYENERLRLALAQSCANAKRWEVELATVNTNNARLTSALTESKSNVEQWQKQLSAYKEENQRLKQRALEAEAARGNADAAQELRSELNLMRDKVESAEIELRNKEEELNILRNSNKSNNRGDSEDSGKEKEEIGRLEAQLEAALGAQDSQRKVLEALNTQLADKIQELLIIHREITSALQP